MIYTASYFNRQGHHGRSYCISRTQPEGFRLPVLGFFLPPGWLLDKYRDEDVTLCCWERGATYCHRSLVASFLRQLGYEVLVA
jgi:hypothetical protein